MGEPPRPVLTDEHKGAPRHGWAAKYRRLIEHECHDRRIAILLHLEFSRIQVQVRRP